VVAATVGTGRGRWLGVAAAVFAIGILVAMALGGREPGGKTLVRLEPAGILRDTPDRITRVELTAGTRRLTFARARGGWTEQRAGAVPAPLTAHLDTALRFLYVSGPTRVMERGEFDRGQLTEFGLDPPRYAIILFADGQPVLKVAFGTPNPMQVAQYVRVEGREELYLIPSFVGREWEQVVNGLPEG
jgi:hypothetical protein